MLVRDGASRCEKHKAKAWASTSGRQTSRHERGYGAAWDKLRPQILVRDGYLCKCAECTQAKRLRPATQVDHKISKAEWRRRHGNLEGCDDPSNLQAINAECHARKTIAEKGHTPKTAIGQDGWPIK